jgi:hypothetical protein
MEPERQRSIEALIVKTFADAEKDAIRDNCCAACEEVPHAGIYVRTTVEALRKMRPT